MKWTVFLVIISAFITAATVRFNIPFPVYEIRKEKGEKSPAIQCTPLYNPSEDEIIPRLTGWGNYSWKITTSSDSAQFYFDQGINMYYAFHIIESRASFDKAIRFDSSCAMGWWGKALAFGPNINDFGYQRPSESYSSAVKATELTGSCTGTEKALIGAMAVRYTSDSTKDQNQLNALYRDAMAKVYQDYPRNADVLTLYADALMLLHPWDLYNHDYSPKPWTPEITEVIKKVFVLNQNHPGANHYYVHAMEASARPQDALKSAGILSELMPEVSHITHMPSHIYIRTGNYHKGIEQNDLAVKGYKKYLQYFEPTNEGLALYSLHNIHMKINCAQMAGNYRVAMAAAKDLQLEIPVFYLSLPGALGNYVQYLYQSALFTQVRFGRWQDILDEVAVDSLAYTSLIQHFARGMAYARTGSTQQAENELNQVRAGLKNDILKEPLTPFNSAYDASVIAENILAGVIAEQRKDFSKAVDHFKAAVRMEDSLVYNEPRDWLLPARHYLGNAFIKAGKYSEAITVLKTDLVINPKNGWDLTGIKTALSKLKKTAQVVQVQRQLREAWVDKDTVIEGPVF
ncbi:MAG: hypothetical protein WKF89_07525 [Chitinophagaceae bacterium]